MITVTKNNDIALHHLLKLYGLFCIYYGPVCVSVFLFFILGTRQPPWLPHDCTPEPTSGGLPHKALPQQRSFHPDHLRSAHQTLWTLELPSGALATHGARPFLGDYTHWGTPRWSLTHLFHYGLGTCGASLTPWSDLNCVPSLPRLSESTALVSLALEAPGLPPWCVKPPVALTTFSFATQGTVQLWYLLPLRKVPLIFPQYSCILWLNPCIVTRGLPHHLWLLCLSPLQLLLQGLCLHLMHFFSLRFSESTALLLLCLDAAVNRLDQWLLATNVTDPGAWPSGC
jgi:hypothetical protein